MKSASKSILAAVALALRVPSALAVITFMAGIVQSAAAAISKEAAYDTHITSIYSVEDAYSDRYDEYVAGTPPTLTADFSTMGDTVFSYTWKAPEGQAFELYVPTGLGWEDYTEYFLQLNMEFGTSTGGFPLPVTFNTMTLGGATGAPFPASPIIDLVAVQNSGSNSSLSAAVKYEGLVVGERYRFESATLTFTIDETYEGVFEDAPLVPSGSFLTGYIYSIGNVHPDPGQILTLVAVPEPSAGVLIFMVLAAGCFARRRSR